MQRDQSLYPRVSYILQLLVVRTVEVRFIRTQPRRAPRNVPYFFQLWHLRFKRCLQFKWISRELSIEILQGKRFTCSLNGELYIPVCSKPQGSELTVNAAVRKKCIMITKQ